MIKKSEMLQAVCDEHQIKEENILFLTIKKAHFDRIKEGTKKVEFRDMSDYYLGKLSNYDSRNKCIGDKPLTHILFQAGYSAASPRMLIEFIDYGGREKGIMRAKPEYKKFIEDESFKEGFEKGDDFLGFVLGKILHIE
jgi:hypothetical protein